MSAALFLLHSQASERASKAIDPNPSDQTMAPASPCALLLLLLFLLLSSSASPPSLASASNVSVCQLLDPSPSLRQFVSALTFPPLLYLPRHGQITLGAYRITQKLHPDLPETALYAYGASQESATFPGPTLVAKRNVEARIRWENHIRDRQHMFTVDETVGWADPEGGGVPIVTHVHGAEVQSLYDGHPEAWFTAQGDTGPSFSGHNYTYPNDQPPASLWYHDHTIGITRLNVAAGLAGMYIIRSDEEDRLRLPLGLPLVLHDRQFFADGSLNFPTLGIVPDLHPQWCPEYFGDTILVNGAVWPYAKVFARPYRFRLLNACSARFFVLSMSDSAMAFYQIGTDGGFAGDGPWNLTSLTMAPSERADVILDFSALRPGDTVVLNNSGATPFPSGDMPDVGGPPGTTAVMEFVVVDDGDEDGIADGIVAAEALPIDLSALVDGDEAPLLEENVAVTRTLSVVEYDDNNHMPVQFTLENKTWVDPVAVTPIEGETELWELMNLRINAHPLHIHLTSFRVLNQQPFANDDYESGECSLQKAYGEEGSCFTEAPADPDDWQKGWKDTVILWPSVVTRVLVRFSARNGSAFAFDPSLGPGYLWHCHIVDHEDNVMMRPFKIVRINSTAALASGGGDTAVMRRSMRD